MSKRRKFNPTERVGLNAVATIFTAFGWIFREQFVGDFGIDAQVEVTKEGTPTGRLFAIQIKAGSSYVRGRRNRISFYASEPHMFYWHSYSLPVILILFDPRRNCALWQWANYDNATQTEKGWRIDFPTSHVLDIAARDVLIGTTPRSQIATQTEKGHDAEKRIDRRYPPIKPMSRARSASVRAAAIDQLIANSMLEYRQSFSPVFERAQGLLRATPLEPSNAMRNAFDHFARAAEFAESIKNHQIKDKDDQRLNQAYLEITRGRRHVALGTYEAVIHMITYRYGQLEKLLSVDTPRTTKSESVSPSDRRSDIEQRLLNVERRMRQFPNLALQRGNSIAEGLSEIRAIERVTKLADRLLMDLEGLHDQLARLTGRNKRQN